jgi:YidC/Oxa1 family membrane protein insertase
VQPMAALRIDLPSALVAAGADATYRWNITGSSMRKDALARLTDAEQRTEFTDGYYRFFKSLAKLLAFFLNGIYLVVRNYGVALIVLTFLLKLALHRFTFKQQASMLKMQKLAPEMKALQEKYKNDRAQVGAKTMELYKKHGVNPLSGCLPMFIQMPMFMALYQVFTHAADFRGSSFLWIKDLTLEDAVWGLDYPYLHWLTINPLALIYIGVTLWMSFQHKVPENADPQQAQMQKMMRYMPLLFGVIFYHMPAGLVLYFTVNAILSTIEIKMVKKKLGIA